MNRIVKYIRNGLLTLALSSQAIAADRVDWIVAIVNEEPILYSELQDEIDHSTRQLIDSGREVPTLESLYAGLLELLIDRKLQLQRARELHVQPTNQDLQFRVDEIIASAGYQTLGELVAAAQIPERTLVKRVAEDLVISEALIIDSGEQLANYQSDFTAALRRNFADQLITEYNLSQLQLPTGTKPQAEQLREQALASGNFVELIKQHSVAANVGIDGELGWLLISELPVALETVLPSMRPSEITEPIELGNGIHLFKLNATRSLVPGDIRIDKVCIQQLVFVGDLGKDQIEQAKETYSSSEVTFEQLANEDSESIQRLCFKQEDLPASVSSVERLRVGDLIGPNRLVDKDDGQSRWLLGLVVEIESLVIGGEELRRQAGAQYEPIVQSQIEQVWTVKLRNYANISILRPRP